MLTQKEFTKPLEKHTQIEGQDYKNNAGNIFSSSWQIQYYLYQRTLHKILEAQEPSVSDGHC